MKFMEFARGIKQSLGELWDRFRQFMVRVYGNVRQWYKTSKLGEERGEFSWGRGDTPKGAAREQVKEPRVETTSEGMSEPSYQSTTEPIKDYIDQARGSLSDMWDKINVFFQQAKGIKTTATVNAYYIALYKDTLFNSHGSISCYASTYRLPTDSFFAVHIQFWLHGERKTC